jgi:hypothetical protein
MEKRIHTAGNAGEPVGVTDGPLVEHESRSLTVKRPTPAQAQVAVQAP